MKKRLVLLLVLMFGWANTPVVAAPTEKDHKECECEKAEELKEQGYSKEDIFMGMMIAKSKDKKVEDVLTLYKEKKSWEETAKELGLTTEEFNKISSMYKWKQFLKENKPAVIEFLAVYVNKKPGDIQSYIDDDISLRFLIGAAAIAKLSNQNIDTIIAHKKEGKNFHDVLKMYNIKHSSLKAELDKFKTAVQKSISEKNM